MSAVILIAITKLISIPINMRRRDTNIETNIETSTGSSNELLNNNLEEEIVNEESNICDRIFFCCSSADNQLNNQLDNTNSSNVDISNMPDPVVNDKDNDNSDSDNDKNTCNVDLDIIAEKTGWKPWEYNMLTDNFRQNTSGTNVATDSSGKKVTSGSSGTNVATDSSDKNVETDSSGKKVTSGSSGKNVATDSSDKNVGTGISLGTVISLAGNSEYYGEDARKSISLIPSNPEWAEPLWALGEEDAEKAGEKLDEKNKTQRQNKVKSWFLKFDKEIESFKNKNKCNISSNYIKLYKSKYDDAIKDYVL